MTQGSTMNRKMKMAQEAYDNMCPDERDWPEVDDIPEEHLRSSCCGDEVTQAKSGVYVCECYRFCKINVDASIEAWDEWNEEE